MGEPDHKWNQGIGYEIRTDVGVSEEKQLECERLIAEKLLNDNDKVTIHAVGHYDRNFNKLIHIYDKENTKHLAYCSKDDVEKLREQFIKCISGLVSEEYKAGYLEALEHIVDKCK